MEKIITFKCGDYPYITDEKLPDVAEALNALKKEITDRNDNLVEDIITEIADSSVDIYTDSLVENCSSVAFMKYIDESIEEIGRAKTHEEQLRMAEFCYYYDSLNENFNAVVRNALSEYMAQKAIIIDGPDKEVPKTAAAVEKYVLNTIENYLAEKSMAASAILDVFERDLETRLETIEDYTKNIKTKITDADDENAAITALCIEPEKPPYLITIPTNNMLANIQNICEGFIEVLPLYSNRADGLEIDMIVNEEGKINGSSQNRIITENDLFNNHSSAVVDIVCGTAVIVAADSNGEWVSLPDDEIKKWNNRFSSPLPTFIGSLYLDDESIEIPNFVDIEKDIININEHSRGDDGEER